MTTTLIEAYYRRLAAFHVPTEEFYDPSQPRDKQGRWTSGSAGRKMWSGTSPHMDDRTPPVPTALTAGDARKIYTADLGGGYTSVVLDVESGEHGSQTDHHVVGEIMHDGKAVGRFDRTIIVDPDFGENGETVVWHNELYIDPDHQGQGLADRFNMHAVSAYQGYGVDSIKLHAEDAVGGFAWARQGFRYDGDDAPRQAFLHKRLKNVEAQLHIPVVRPFARKLRKEIAALRKAIDANEDVQPIHIASIGEGYVKWKARDENLQTYETWPGKQALLGSSWSGVYYFDAERPITAAATDLLHAELRPAFKTDRYEEFYDPSQPRDREGRWALIRAVGGARAGGSFGGRMSAPRDNRTPPTPAFKKLDKRTLDKLGVPEGKSTDDRAKAFMRSWYEADLPNGHRAVVTSVIMHAGNGGAVIEGKIVNKFGDKRGTFERNLRFDSVEYYDPEVSTRKPGEYQRLKSLEGIEVTHDSFYLDDIAQGQGIAQAFNSHATAQYQKYGVDRVRVHAADTVGGYAWAREGFRIEDGTKIRSLEREGRKHDYDSTRHGSIGEIVRHAEGKLKSMTVELGDRHALADETLGALLMASWAGQDVQPIHIASIGEDTMRYKRRDSTGREYDTWPGKEMMLGANWSGTYYFDANTAVTAAARHALMEFYDASQPRDKRGRWSRSASRAAGEPHPAKCTPRPCVVESIERIGAVARQVMHEKIVKDLLADGSPPPTMTILGGGGGSGKSTIVQAFKLGIGQATVNADDIKEKIPEYKTLVADGDHSAAAFVHEESSHISKQAQAKARELQVGVLLDQVGSDPKKVTAQVQSFLDAGYKSVNAVYVTIPTELAVTRAQERAKRTGRAVPLEVLRAGHRDVSRGFTEIASNQNISDIKLYDNSGESPKLIASGGKGVLVIHDRKAYDDFLAKGDE